MYEADYNAMYKPEFLDLPNVCNYGLQSSVNDGALHIGMKFASKEEAMMAIKSYNIRNSIHSRVDRSTMEKYVCYYVQRDNGCKWMVRVSKRKRKNNLWELTRYNGPHTFCAIVKCYKTVVQIDGTFLYEKYKLVLLLVVVQDGNYNILPVAFAFVQGDHTKSWAFFLKNLRLHVVTRERVCIISDRGAEIKPALDSLGPMWKPPHVQHHYCVRHIAANYYGKYKKNDERQLVVHMVHGVEDGFGAHEHATTGIFEVEPRQCPGFTFRKSILIGRTDLGPKDVRAFMEKLAKEYSGNSYHLISNNCNHFCNDECVQLTSKPIPRWVNRLARLGPPFVECKMKTLVLAEVLYAVYVPWPTFYVGFLCNCVLPAGFNETKVRQVRSGQEAEKKKLSGHSSRYMSSANPLPNSTTSGSCRQKLHLRSSLSSSFLIHSSSSLRLKV
ncbi:ERF003 protein [Hibiscus syriacus]|uniref:ERF003 protein n=1 Tax=Hibiscus syriacus TaxID=106335 RepID=A0A6A2YGD3_HIBSY|nr:ERF003 protein [Hibiscus syriacus]